MYVVWIWARRRRVSTAVTIVTPPAAMAARPTRPPTFLAGNMESPRLVGEAAQANNVKKVVFVSAIGARPDPKYEYLVSRWAGEEALKRTGAPYVILRFSFILGEDGGVVD